MNNPERRSNNRSNFRSTVLPCLLIVAGLTTFVVTGMALSNGYVAEASFDKMNNIPTVLQVAMVAPVPTDIAIANFQSTLPAAQVTEAAPVAPVAPVAPKIVSSQDSTVPNVPAIPVNPVVVTGQSKSASQPVPGNQAVTENQLVPAEQVAAAVHGSAPEGYGNDPESYHKFMLALWGPELGKAAWDMVRLCEDPQFDLTHVNASNDVGLMQINQFYWGKLMRENGYDPTNPYDSMKFADKFIVKRTGRKADFFSQWHCNFRAIESLNSNPN